MNFQADDLDKKVIADVRKECVNKKEKKTRKRTGDDYFLIRKRGMIRNPEYRKFFSSKGTAYEYVWMNIVRDNMNNDKHNIKEDYYDKGFLAYCSTYNHIADECFMDKNTAQKHMEALEAKGAIKIIKIGPTPTKKDKRGRIIDRRPSVFILGTWTKILDKNGKEKIVETYWLEDVFYN